MSSKRLLFWVVFFICLLSPLVVALTPRVVFGSWLGCLSVLVGYLTYLALLAPKVYGRANLSHGQWLCFWSTISVRTLSSQYLAFFLLLMVIPPFFGASPTAEIMFYGCVVSGLASFIDFKLNKLSEKFSEDPTTNR